MPDTGSNTTKYSIAQFPGDGSTVSWEINFSDGYLDTTHVKAFSTDSATGTRSVRDLDWNGPNTVVIDPPVPVGSILTIYRDTPKDKPIADFSDGAVVSEQSLDVNAKQAVFIAAEASDWADLSTGRSLMVPDGTRGTLIPPLDDLKGMLLGFDENGVGIPVSPITTTPSDTLGILHEGKQLASVLEAEISLAPEDVISIVADTTLDITALNRMVVISGSATAITLNMPPADNNNIGDCVFISIDPAFIGLATCTAYPGSGCLFGEQPNRVLHAGETALVRFDGSGWSKVVGRSRPFAGLLLSTASVVLDAGGGWTTIPTNSRSPDNEPSAPWFDANRIVIPRKGTYRAECSVWINGVAMPTPNYGSPVGTEQGAPIDIGIANTAGSSPVDFDRTQIPFNAPFVTKRFWMPEQVLTKGDASLNTGNFFSVVARIVTPLTGATAVALSDIICTKLGFEEINPW